MLLSKEAQALANDTVAEEDTVSKKEIDSLYNLILEKKKAAPQSPQPAITVVESRGKKINPLYLVAATVALLALMGAGYATSLYFNKMYQRFDVPAEYDAVTDDPQTLVEYPAAGNQLPVVEVTGLGRLYLAPAFDGRKSGELFETELSSGEQSAVATGLKGSGLGLLYRVNNRGEAGMDKIVINPAGTQAVIDKKIAAGKFMVTLNHPAFTAAEYWEDPYYQSLHYKDSNDNWISLTMDPHRSAAGQMPGEIYDNANPEDITVNGNRFVLIQLGNSYLANLYLGDYDQTVTSTVSITFGEYRKDRDKVMEILQAIEVHNKEANKIAIAGESFFAGVALPAVRDNAAQIAGAIPTASDDNHLVWDQDSVMITSYQGGWNFVIRSAEAFNKESAFYPYNGQHTAITDQGWFHKEKFTGLSVTYYGTEAVSSTYYTEDGSYALTSVIVDNGYVRSPLDAIIFEAGNESSLQLERVINPTSENPMVVVKTRNDNVTVFSARKMDEGKYLVQSLFMPEDQLPNELA